MLQRNEKGKIARQYFLQLEKDWNSPEKVMARALLMADRKINEQNHQIQALTAQTEEMRPKALFADSVKAADTSILIGELAKILRQNGSLFKSTASAMQADPAASTVTYEAWCLGSHG